MNRPKMQSVPLKNIKICDNFWNRYTNLVHKEIIPYQWAILNDQLEDVAPTHCLENFRIAAGEAEGCYQGAIFQDSDVAKWLEAVAYSLETHPDPELEKLADETIELIERAQQPDGYLNTYFTIKEPDLRWKNLREGHELYTAGHFIEAGVAYYNATGKRRLLNIVCRMADLICSLFGEDGQHIDGYPGHPEIELALVKLYRATGEKKYLRTASYFIERRGKEPNCFVEESKKPGYRRIFLENNEYDPYYAQNHLPVRQQESAEGHAVRAVYLYSGMADVAYETGDDSLLEACKRLWNNIVNKRMYINGSIGSSAYLERFTVDYDLPNDSGYSETCASIGLALFGLRMAQITGEAHYFDQVELALYNTVTAGIGLDGKSFFYVNPLEVWPENCIPNTSRSHVKPVRQKWFGVACCPPNIARTLASLGQYIYATKDNTLFLNLFVGNQATVSLDSGELKVRVDSRFPWEDTINIETESETGCMMGIRIPSYVHRFKIAVNGDSVQYTMKNGYVMVPVVQGKSRIDLSFSIKPRLVYPNELIRACAGQVAIMRGPLLYCIEEMDNPTPLSSLIIDKNTSFTEQWDSALGGMITIFADGWRESSPKGAGLYHEMPCKREATRLKFVPYCFWCNRDPGEMRVWIRAL